jgi:uncharacterized glyoxalase superfamily protein PhnB
MRCALIVEDVDELYRELEDRGGPVTDAPRDQPWGMREFAIRTIDGHMMMFGQQKS